MSRKAFTVVAVVALVALGGAAWLGVGLLRGRDAAARSAATTGERVDGAVPGGGTAADGAQRGAAQPAAADAAVPATSSAGGLPDKTTLVLAGGEVLVSYPAGFGLAVTQEQLAVESSVPPCDQGFDYCVYLDAGELDGTTVTSAGLRIDQRDDLANEAACMLEQPSGFTDLVPVIAGASDFATSLYRDVDQGAAGHVSQGAIGRLYYDSVCYEFETRVAQLGAAARDVVEGSHTVESATTESRLLDLLGGVTLPDGRSSLWARGVASTLGRTAERTAPSLELRQPAVGASSPSPLLVAGEAPGGWFFEATFPYRLVAADGRVLASGAILAGADWMTEGQVPFEASIEFEVDAPTDAILVLTKDNPSALPHNDASVEVPLHLLP